MAKEVWECLGITETELDLLNLAVYEFEKPDRERVARINEKYATRKTRTPEEIEKEKREYQIWLQKKAKENRSKKR